MECMQESGKVAVNFPSTSDWCLDPNTVGEIDLEVQKIFSSAMLSIDDVSYSDFRMAKSGATPVYYSPDKNVVLKRNSRDSAEILSNTGQAYELCRNQGLTHLIVPLSRSYKEFLIAQCIPFGSTAAPDQMWLYSNNKDAFTEAAKELTRFFCHAHIGDLVDDWNRVKYDNIPLYLDATTGEGKIALIDLEEFHLKSFVQFSPHAAEELFEEEEEDTMFPSVLKGCFKKESKDFSPKLPLDTVIFRLFPYHLNEIMDELKKFYPDAERYRENFQSVCSETLQYFRYLKIT